MLFSISCLQLRFTYRSVLMDGNITKSFNRSENLVYPQVASSVIFSIQASLAVIANILVVFLFTCRRHLLCNPHSRCILSLAITDVLTGISLVFCPRLTTGEAFYNPSALSFIAQDVYCRILWSNFLPFAFGIASVYISVVFSFERWLAVRRSIFYKTRFKIRHMNMLILASWITGFTAEVPIIFFVEVAHDQPSEICRFVLAKNKSLSTLLSTGWFLFQTAVPLVLMTLAYIDVFRGIKASLRFAASARAENITTIKRSKKVTMVAAITTFVLVICWLPCSVYFFVTLLLFQPLEDYSSPLLWLIALLAFSNSCINPWIYVFSNPELRNAFKSMFHY